MEEPVVLWKKQDGPGAGITEAAYMGIHYIIPSISAYDKHSHNNKMGFSLI